jgi:hypothetical protein
MTGPPVIVLCYRIKKKLLQGNSDGERACELHRFLFLPIPTSADSPEQLQKQFRSEPPATLPLLALIEFRGLN